MPSQDLPTRRLAAIAFADIAGWSRMVERNDAATLAAWQSLRHDLIEPGIATHGGRLLEVAGDAVIVEFPSAVAAVSWALDLQKAVAEHGRDRPPRLPGLALRIGVNVEDAIVDGDKLVGDGVNIAARIQQLAEPGEIVVTEAVRDYVWNKLTATLRDLGERRLKNISRPIRLFRVEPPGGAAPGPAAPPHWGSRTLLAIGNASARARAQAIEQLLSVARLPHAPATMTTGEDGMVLLEFASARQAAASAFALREASGLDPGAALLLRMGLEVSHPSSGSHAPQFSLLAAPGEIVASAGVRDQLTPVLDADIEDLGDCYPEPSAQPVRAYRIAPPHSLPEVTGAVAAGELRPTIAVIPFSSRSPDPGDQVLGELLADETIHALSRAAEMNVISRLSTTSFRDRKATLQEVRAHLHATYVASGSYAVSGTQLLLAVELAEAESGQVVWAGQLKGPVAGVSSGKDELVHRIVAGIGSAVVTRELQRTQTQALPSLDSHTLLIGAIALMHRLSLRDFQRAQQMLLTLTERAPRLAVPQAWLAKWHVLRVQQGWSGDPAAEARAALGCTRRALDADPDCSLALAVDGFVHTNLLKQLDIAEGLYDHAIRVNPNEALAWLLKGTLHAFRGEGQQAVKGTHRALRLSPLDPHRYFFDSLAASAELSAGHYERAIDLARRSLRANRTHTSTLRVLAISQWQLGRQVEARATVDELLRIEPTLTVNKWLARSPSSDYAIGKLCADALRGAGVPE